MYMYMCRCVQHYTVHLYFNGVKLHVHVLQLAYMHYTAEPWHMTHIKSKVVSPPLVLHVCTCIHHQYYMYVHVHI